MSFNYLTTSYTEITELRKFRKLIYDDFQDFIRYSPTLSSHHIIKFIKVNKNTAIY